MTAADARMNTAPAARDLVRPLPFVSSVIGHLLAVLITDETIRSHIFAVVFSCFPRPFGLNEHQSHWEAIQSERTDRSQPIEKEADHDQGRTNTAQDCRGCRADL